MLAFGETSFDSLLLPLLTAGLLMGLLRAGLSVCRSVTRARDARLIAKAVETRRAPLRNA